MRIDIYSKYKVRFLSSGAYISQEDSTPDDYVFSHYEEDNEEIIDGSKLLGILKYKLENNYLQEISIKDNTIRIETFNYNNGEGDDLTIVVDRIEGENDKN
jgi:hypothetical protein